MVSIVLASHGAFAEGIKQSGQMIFGPQDNVAAVTLTPDMGPDDFRAKVLDAVAKFDDQKQVLFLVDLWGGTPFNQISKLLDEEGHENWVALTGLNLPMVISAYGSRLSAETAADVAKEIYPEAKSGVRIKPEDLEPAEAAPAAASAAPAATGTLAPGTVVGDGKIKIGLVRIDSRLLHGQVATAWTKTVGPTRIIVVSDGVAHDDMRKTLITEAAPPGVKANVIPISKCIEIFKDTRFGGQKILFLFEKVEDVERCVDGGVPFKNVNVGSMAHSAGKTMVNNTCSIDAEDAKAFKHLHDEGVDFYYQMVPSSEKSDFYPLVEKSGLAN